MNTLDDDDHVRIIDTASRRLSPIPAIAAIWRSSADEDYRRCGHRMSRGDDRREDMFVPMITSFFGHFVLENSMALTGRDDSVVDISPIRMNKGDEIKLQEEEQGLFVMVTGYRS